MEVTLEQVETVKKYADISFEEAKAVLTQAGGSPLDAVILLEQQGRICPSAGGSWSTRFGAPSPEVVPAIRPAPSAVRPRPRHRKYTAQEVGDAVKSFLRNCTKISVDIWRKDDLLVGIPLVVCVLLLIVAYQIMVPLAILGLFLRCRYHISGWEGNMEPVNRAMDQVTETVAGWVDKAGAEWGGRHHKDRQNR